MEKRLLPFRILIWTGIAVLSLFICFGILKDLKETQQVKQDAINATAKDLQLTQEEKKILDPSKILDRIYNQEYDRAEEYFKNELPEWDLFESSEHLKTFFENYFDLRYALSRCIELKKPVEDITKDIKKLLDKNKDSKIYNERDKENKYLNGKAMLSKGIDTFANYISVLESYMDTKKHGDTPVFDIIEILVKYDGLKKVDVKNFAGLLKNYEDYVITNRHDKSLTKNDATVVCLKLYYMMEDAADKSDNTRKQNAKKVVSEISRLKDEYPDYIGERGSLKEYMTYISTVDDYAKKFISDVGKNQIKKLIKEKDKSIGKDKIPGLFTEGTKK